MASESEQTGDQSAENVRPGQLVPLYGGTDIVPGVQAFRRGDIVLYSVRGEPEVVRELVGKLGEEGVDEVVAFISHRTDGQEEEEEGSEQ